MSRAVNQRFRY